VTIGSMDAAAEPTGTYSRRVAENLSLLLIRATPYTQYLFYFTAT